MNTVAVYAGSFNPFHIGHLNVVKKAEAIFGKSNVIIARGLNPEKWKAKDLNEFVEKDEQFKALGKKIGCVTATYYGYLHKFLQELEDQGVSYVLLRGLRNATDLAYEENQLKFIREFKPGIRTMFIMCDPELNHISSSAIRNMNSIEPGSGDLYIVHV